MAPALSNIGLACYSYLIFSELLKDEARVKKKRQRKIWVSSFLKTRRNITLLKDIREDDGVGLFKNFSRMSQEDFNFLLSNVEEKISKKDTNYRESIPASIRLAITLRYLATGDSIASLMFLFRVSKQTISRVIPEVCKAIIEALEQYIKIPRSEEEWLHVSKDFAENWNFPNVVGAVDGKHVVIQAPPNSGSEYFNYKSFFSIVLFALVDANYNFLFVDVGCQGRISDGGVFKNTRLYNDLQCDQLNLPHAKHLPGQENPVPYVILGDEAFALNDNLMKPYSGIFQKGSEERIFNYRLSRCRRVVENAFGILSSVFRVLRKPILLKTETAKLVVLACVYLHNFLRHSNSSSNKYCPPGFLDREVDGEITFGSWRDDAEMSSLLPLRKIPVKPKENPRRIRESFAHYFISDVGKLPWQDNYA